MLNQFGHHTTLIRQAICHLDPVLNTAINRTPQLPKMATIDKAVSSSVHQ